jgi:hypothetical protein
MLDYAMGDTTSPPREASLFLAMGFSILDFALGDTTCPPVGGTPDEANVIRVLLFHAMGLSILGYAMGDTTSPPCGRHP